MSWIRIFLLGTAMIGQWAVAECESIKLDITKSFVDQVSAKSNSVTDFNPETLTAKLRSLKSSIKNDDSVEVAVVATQRAESHGGGDKDRSDGSAKNTFQQILKRSIEKADQENLGVSFDLPSIDQVICRPAQTYAFTKKPVVYECAVNICAKSVPYRPAKVGPGSSGDSK